jgi:hypothetical protein
MLVQLQREKRKEGTYLQQKEEEATKVHAHVDARLACPPRSGNSGPKRAKESYGMHALPLRPISRPHMKLSPSVMDARESNRGAK